MAAPVTLTYGTSVDETLTLSWTNLVPGIRDNVFNSFALLKWLYNTKKVKKRGGVDISHGLMYGKNTTAQSYGRYEQLDVTPVDGLLRDRWGWAQYSVSESIDGFTERIANKGDQAIENALEEKKNHAELSLSDLLNQHFFKASPASTDIRSLPVIVLDSGSEGDISGTTSTWWQSTVTASGSFAARGRSDLTVLYNTLSARNPSGSPEIIVSDQTSFEAYESSLVSQVRFSDTKMADIGIRNLLFKDTPWIWDLQATSGVIYVLTSKALHLYVNSDTDFVPSAFVKPANQDARVAQIYLACALTTSVRRKLGKLTGVTA